MLRTVARAFVGDAELTERQGAILVASAGVIFSFGAIAFRGVESASDWQFLTFRGGSIALAMVALTLVRRRSRPVRFRGTSWQTVVAGILMATMSMLYILALARTSAATTLFMLAASPVVAAGFGWLLLRERIDRATVIATTVVAVGVVVTVGAGLDAGSNLGVLFAAMIPVALGLYSVMLRSTAQPDPVVPTLIAGVLLGVGAGVVSLAGEGLDLSARDVLLACLSGGVFLGIGLPLLNLAHRSVRAATVSLLLMTEVVLGPIWVWIWPGETPSGATLAGGAIVIGAVTCLLLHASADEDGLASPKPARVS